MTYAHVELVGRVATTLRARLSRRTPVTNLRVAIDRPIQALVPDTPTTVSPFASGTTPSTTSSLLTKGQTVKVTGRLDTCTSSHRTDVYSCCHRPHRTDATGDTRQAA